MQQKGITLVEMLVTVSIITVILLISIPTIGISSAKLRAETTAEQLQQLIQFARTSAVIYGQPVTICPMATTLSCGTDWADGWIAYRNVNDATQPTAKTILRVVKGRPKEYSLQLKAFADNAALCFQPWSNAAYQNGRFYFQSKVAAFNWQMIISKTGRVRLDTALT